MEVSLKFQGLADDIETATGSPGKLLSRVLRTGLFTRIYTSRRTACKENPDGEFLLLAAEGEGPEMEVTIESALFPMLAENEFDIIFGVSETQPIAQLSIELGQDLTILFDPDSARTFVRAMGKFIAAFLRLGGTLEGIPLQLHKDDPNDSQKEKT